MVDGEARGRYAIVILAAVTLTYFTENFIARALLLVVIIFAPVGTTVTVYAALMGGIGFSQSIWVLFFPMISETLPPETTGIAQGLVNGIGTLGFALLSPVYGTLVDVTGGYGTSNMLVIATSVLSTIIYVLFTKETYGGANGSED